MYDSNNGGFLGILPSSNTNTLTVCVGPWKDFVHERLGANADKFLGNEWFSGTELVKTMVFLTQDEFLNNYSYLVWRVIEDDLGPADGIYTLSTSLSGQNNPALLDIPLTQYLEPALLVLKPPEPRVTGSQWWKVTSTIDQETARYSYVLGNYRSGHYLELIDSATAKPDGSIVPSLKGTRVVDPKDHAWRFIRINGMGFQIWSRDNENCFLQGNTAMVAEIAIDDGARTPTIWTMTKIPEGYLLDGNETCKGCFGVKVRLSTISRDL